MGAQAMRPYMAAVMHVHRPAIPLAQWSDTGVVSVQRGPVARGRPCYTRAVA